MDNIGGVTFHLHPKSSFARPWLHVRSDGCERKLSKVMHEMMYDMYICTAHIYLCIVYVVMSELGSRID